MKYQQSSKREEKSKFITNQLTNMAHIPIRSYLYLLLGTTLFSCAPQELKTPFELKCENIPVPVGVDTQTPRLSWKLPLLEEDSINRQYSIIRQTVRLLEQIHHRSSHKSLLWWTTIRFIYNVLLENRLSNLFQTENYIFSNILLHDRMFITRQLEREMDYWQTWHHIPSGTLL